MSPTYRGLTWDHPRGYNALAAAARDIAPGQGLAISWDKQPLEGFESHPIADLCARYDLVVLDHPHIGEAVASDCLQPLEAVFSAATLAEIAGATIGPCLSSYRYAGRHWALPLDSASQVMAYRADLARAVVTWDDILVASRDGGVGVTLAGPHAVLTLLSIATSLGDAPAEDEPRRLLRDDTGAAAYELLAELASRSPISIAALNPIGILGHMATHDDVRLVPLIYGYVNYARPAAGAKAVAFANTPRGSVDGRMGTVLGGTGIGISKRCEVTPELIAHLGWLLGAEAQLGFIPDHDGQPSRRAAWQDGKVNADWPNFYAPTQATLETAYVRPRYAGYIAWQTASSAYVRECLASRRPAREVVEHLNRTHLQAIGDKER